MWRSAATWLACVALLAAGAPASAQNNQMLVRVDRVKIEPLAQKVPVLGRLVARQAGKVAARINGPVEAFHVEVGDEVEVGQVIAEINSSYLAAERNQSAAQLAKAEAGRTTAKAQLELAEQQLERLAALKKSASFSQAVFDDAELNVAIAEARVMEA